MNISHILLNNIVDMKENYANYTALMTRDKKSITLLDYGRILKQIQNDLDHDLVPPQILHHIYLMAATSKKYYSEKIPDNIVTLNSEILIVSDKSKKQKIKIVFPQDVINPGDVSIYSPIGAACLGSYEKSRICYFDGADFNKAIIEKVLFQPEKEKLFYL
jgi:hypothetical protein